MIKGANHDIGEPPPRWRVRSVPIATVLLASALPLLLPLIASSPILPPFGLMMFLAWRLLRPEIWPVWAALPFGLWDDLFSGAAIGTAVALWTFASIAIDYFELRIYWRGFRHDWGIAALAIAFVQIVAAWIMHPDVAPLRTIALVLPQVVLAILLMPLAMRLAGWFDSLRLRRR